MNAIATVNPGLVPANMTEAMKLAEMMAGAKLVPKDLQKSPADCLMVIQQAVRWQMDPFAVAQECSVIQGKLMHSGKLVAAVVNARGELAERLSFAYMGEGDERTITVSGRLQGENAARSVSVRLGSAKTNNRVWQSQPDQQLMYHGCRVWARRHTPELMLGVWSPEEFDEAANGNATAPVVIEHDTPTSGKPAKRTMAEISANKKRREDECAGVQKDLSQIETLSELERYQAEHLTPQFMSSLGNAQWAVEEFLETRRNELSEPTETVDEDGVITTDSDASEALRNEMIDRIEAVEGAEALHRLANTPDWKSAIGRLTEAHANTVRRHWKARLDKAPTEA